MLQHHYSDIASKISISLYLLLLAHRYFFKDATRALPLFSFRAGIDHGMGTHTPGVAFRISLKDHP